MLASVAPRCYRPSVTTVVKRSVSIPSDVFAALAEEARAEGVGVSVALTEAARQWLLIRGGLRGVSLWEAEHGALTRDELAAADALLDGVRG
jgi:hypothetical protein